MKLDDLNLNVNSNKVSKLLDDKFGTKVNLGSLNLRQLNRLKESVARAHAKTVKSMPFNSGHRNPEYLEQVALLEAIELRINEVEQVDEVAPKSWEGSMNKEKEEEKTPAPITGSQSSALLRLVGSKNIVKAKRAIQLANQGKSIPANLVTGFKPIVDMLLDILQGGPSYVNRLKSLDKQALGASGLNEGSSFTVRVRHGLGTKADYKKINVSADDKEHASAVAMKKAKKLGLKNAKVSSITLNESFNLFEGETEKAQLIMAVKDMVDRVQGMVEDLSKMKVEDLVALTDKMRDEFGQEQASAFTTSADGILSAGIDNLTNARTEMDNAVLTLTGQAPAAAPGAELGAEQPAPAAGAEIGAEMPAPEAGAELPAPEGGEEVGRELRESKVRRNIRSSNRFLATLAK